MGCTEQTFTTWQRRYQKYDSYNVQCLTLTVLCIYNSRTISVATVGSETRVSSLG